MFTSLLRVLTLALGLLLPSSALFAQGTVVGPGQLVICSKTPAFVAAGPTSITTIIPAVAGQSIFVCGWHITNTGAAGTFSFQVSTSAGANCGGAPVPGIPAVNVTSTAPSADHIEYASMQVPVGQSLCVTPSVATISFVVWYNQF